MERHPPSCQAPTNKSFRRRMEERSEWLKQTRGSQKVTNDVTKERTPVDAVEELDNLHRKWRDEQFHFDDHRTESLEQRDEDVGSRDHAKDTGRSGGSPFFPSNSKASRLCQRIRASTTETTGTLHETKCGKVENDLTLSNARKEKLVDVFLENMIQKLQKQNDDARKPGRQKRSDKGKEDKRKKLLSLLIDIKQKLKEKISDPDSLVGNEAPRKKVSFKVTSPRAADSLEATIPSQPKQSIRLKNTSINSPENDEYAVIPKDIIVEMQKLLSAHRNTDPSAKAKSRGALRRLPNKSILDAIPENESLTLKGERSSTKESPDHSFRKARGKEERLRRGDKQRHVVADDMVNRAVDCFGCGKITDLVLPPKTSGNYSLGSR